MHTQYCTILVLRLNVRGKRFASQVLYFINVCVCMVSCEWKPSLIFGSVLPFSHLYHFPTKFTHQSSANKKLKKGEGRGGGRILHETFNQYMFLFSNAIWSQVWKWYVNRDCSHGVTISLLCNGMWGILVCTLPTWGAGPSKSNRTGSTPNKLSIPCLSCTWHTTKPAM